MTAEEIKRTIFKNLLEAEQAKETYKGDKMYKMFLGAWEILELLVEDLDLEEEYNEYKKNK